MKIFPRMFKAGKQPGFAPTSQSVQPGRGTEHPIDVYIAPIGHDRRRSRINVPLLTKVGMAPLVAGIALLAILALQSYATQQLEQDAAAINRAGSERMRLFKMVLLTQDYAGQRQPEQLRAIHQEMDTFESVLRALRSEMSMRTMEPAQAPLLAQINASIEEWEKVVKPLFLGTLAASATQKNISVLKGRVFGYVDNIDRLVTLRQAESERKLRTLHELSGLFIGASILICIGSLVFINKIILRPIRAMTSMSRAIAGNDFSRRMPVTTSDEIGQLAEDFNDMSDRLDGQITTLNRNLATEETLRAQALLSEARYMGLVHEVDAILWEANAATQEIVFVSKSAEKILGYPVEQINRIGFWTALAHPEERAAVTAGYRALQVNGGSNTFRYRVHAADGRVVWIRDNVNVIPAGQQRAEQLRGVIVDITEQKVAAAQIEQLAFYDALTGLPNRALLMDRLTQAVALARRHDHSLALLFLDLNRFKEVNDTKGHHVGDQVLVEIARRFQATLRSGETLARLGGDEFVVIAEQLEAEAAPAIAGRLQAALTKPVRAIDQDFSLGASIGIALYPSDADSPEDLLKFADIAMYRSKTEGGGFHLYRPEMGNDLAEQLQIAQRLQLALEGDQLQLHYQPKICLQTGALCGAEALLRWHDPETGWMSPAIFIPIAEERDMINDIGEWVLSEACRQLQSWCAIGLRLPGRLSVNVAAQQIGNPDFASQLRTIVMGAGLDPCCIELELTESGLMENVQGAIEMLDKLKSAGFSLSIDDFGTGYSSLSYLKRFPADTLKVDISFVRDMLNDSSDYVIVSTIIGMAHSLGLTALAEGIENAEQAQALLQLGCDEAQGFYYGHPVSAREFAETWLAERVGPGGTVGTSRT